MNNDKALEAAPMQFFSENVDKWGAAEWFKRLADAVVAHDKAIVDGNDISAETYRRIISSSAFRLARDFGAEVTSRLSALPGEAEVVAYRRFGALLDPLVVDRSHKENPGLWDLDPLVTLASYQSMQARAEKAEGECSVVAGQFRYASKSNAKNWDDLQDATKRAEAAEARVKELEEALAYAVKGLDMIHNGLMDPTRPRQSVGEVCAHFLSTARTGGSNG